MTNKQSAWTAAAIAAALPLFGLLGPPGPAGAQMQSPSTPIVLAANATDLELQELHTPPADTERDTPTYSTGPASKSNSGGGCGCAGRAAAAGQPAAIDENKTCCSASEKAARLAAKPALDDAPKSTGCGCGR